MRDVTKSDLTGFFAAGSLCGLWLLQSARLQSARTSSASKPARLLIDNAIDHAVFGTLLPRTTLYEQHTDNSRAWHEALNVSGHDCESCGTDTTWGEISVRLNGRTRHLCPDCAEIPVITACPRCDALTEEVDMCRGLRNDARDYGHARIIDICSHCATMPRQHEQPAT